MVDNNGKTNFAFYLQKQTTTATFAAGVGRVAGLEGQPVTALTGLEWQHRNDGWCGAGAPRWTIVVTGSDGDTYFVHLGCAAATHSAGDAPNWIRDSYTGAEIQTAVQDAILAQGGMLAAVSGATIDRLLIIFDEGTDIAGNPGFVYLGNITVNSKVWTGPADNGN